VGRPCVQVGITIPLKDDSGGMVIVALYNQLPGGAIGQQGQRLADAKFPACTRLSIAEPFLKVELTPPVIFVLVQPLL